MFSPNSMHIDLLSTDRVRWYGFEGQTVPCLSRLHPDHANRIIQENHHLSDLGRHTSGIMLSFETDATTMHFDVRLMRPSVMRHMTPLSESGIDVYLMNDRGFHYLQSIGPDAGQKSYDGIIRIHDVASRKYLVYLPLYNGIDTMHVSIDGSFLKPSNIDFRQTWLVYGTSVTQGACASRPGLSMTAILSRMLDVEMVNFGFSGNGLGERSVTDMIASINRADGIIIDYEANAGAVGKLIPTLPVIIETFRKYHKTMPILILGRIPLEMEAYNEDARRRRLDHHAFYIELMKLLKDPNLAYIPGSYYFPDPTADMTVDGIHLNDYGFHWLTEHLKPHLIPWMT